jgi:hypothetical protein
VQLVRRAVTHHLITGLALHVQLTRFFVVMAGGNMQMVPKSLGEVISHKTFYPNGHALSS